MRLQTSFGHNTLQLTRFYKEITGYDMTKIIIGNDKTKTITGNDKTKIISVNYKAKTITGNYKTKTIAIFKESIVILRNSQIENTLLKEKSKERQKIK